MYIENDYNMKANYRQWKIYSIFDIIVENMATSEIVQINWA